MKPAPLTGEATLKNSSPFFRSSGLTRNMIKSIPSFRLISHYMSSRIHAEALPHLPNMTTSLVQTDIIYSSTMTSLWDATKTSSPQRSAEPHLIAHVLGNELTNDWECLYLHPLPKHMYTILSSGGDGEFAIKKAILSLSGLGRFPYTLGFFLFILHSPLCKLIASEVHCSQRCNPKEPRYCALEQRQ